MTIDHATTAFLSDTLAPREIERKGKKDRKRERERGFSLKSIKRRKITVTTLFGSR